MRKPSLGSRVDWSQSINKGLAGWWLFNEGSGDRVEDISLNGNRGILTNVALATAWVVGGNPAIAGYTLDFDGVDDFIDFNTIVSPSVPRTVSIWVNPSSSWSVESGYILTSYAASGSTGYSILVEVSDKTVGIGNNQVVNEVQTTEGLSTDTWTYLVVVFGSDNTGTIYFDGIQKASGDIGAETTQVNHDILGARWDTAEVDEDREFNGLMDNLRILNRAWTPSEVMESYVDPFLGIQQRRRTLFVSAVGTVVQDLIGGLGVIAFPR